MKERSNIQQPWHGVVNIERDGSRYIIRDLMVRWNEQTEEKEIEDGIETEYVYDAYRFDFELPPEVQPGIEAIEFYLEAAQAAILQLAQDLEAQEAGVSMTLSEAQQKRLNDLAIGKIVTGQISIDDQIAALRKQITALSKAAKVPLDVDFKALEDLVVAEKAKKEKKAEPVKSTKKTAKKAK